MYCVPAILTALRQIFTLTVNITNSRFNEI
jgi:hypothetical protein